MTELDPNQIVTRVASPRMIRLEDILLFFGAAIIIIIITTQTEFEVFVPFVFGLFALVFVIEKILLGDSLRFTSFTLPSFFIIVYIILMSFSSMFVFSEMDHPIKYTYFVALQSVLITFPIGVALANLLVHNPSKIITNYLYSNLKKTQDDLKFLPVYKALLFSSFLILTFYFLYSNYVPLIEVIKAYPTSIDEQTLRFSENELPKIVQYLFELLRRFILPVCVFYAYFLSYVYKSKWKYRFWLLFSLTLLVNALTLDRGMPIALFAMMILAYLLARNQSIFKVLNIKLITLLVIAMSIGGIISILQYQRDFSSEKAIAYTWYVSSYGITQDSAFMASLAFELFNDKSGFLYGGAIRMFSIFPGFSYVESHANDQFHELAAAPVSFVGDLWRNWGWLGVIVGTICIGFVYQLVQLKLFRTKSITSLSFQVILLMGSVMIIHGNVLGIATTSAVFFGVLFGLLTAAPRKRPGWPHHKAPLDEAIRALETQP